MNDLFIGQIVLFAGSFAPRNTAYCNGQLLLVVEYPKLYAVIGTTYGGDGKATFALPDLCGRIPLQPGTGSGLSPITLGEKGGLENTSLTLQQLPTHKHTTTGKIRTPNAKASTNDPTHAFPAQTNYPKSITEDVPINSYGTTSDVNMGSDGVNIRMYNTGNGQPYSRMQPFLGLNYIIYTDVD